MPSGTSAGLSLLAGPSWRTEEPVYADRAKALVAAVSGQVARKPEAFPSLLVALNRLRLGDTGPRQYAAQGVVRVRARAVPGQAENGSIPAGGHLVIEIEMAPGWHINAHRPLQDYLVPTALTGVEGRGWDLGEPSYPEPEVLRLSFAQEPLALYQGRVRIEAPYERSQGSAGPGPSPSIPLRLHLQACSDRLCRPPETLVLEVPTATP
jgi:hypothetical protein